MTVKTSTFAGQLLHFAQSVDIVDDSTFDNVRTLVYSYLENELGSEYFELLREELPSEGDGDRQVWLRTFWSSEDQRHFWPLHAASGGPCNAVTRAFEVGKPLWLLSPDKGPLEDSGDYVDQWSRVEDLPRYRRAGGQPARTVIVVPLFHRRSLGAYYLEVPRYIEMTDVAAVELKRLGSALAILFDLYDVNKDQSSLTAEAINDLRTLLSSAKFPKLTKPHFFIASSAKADETVRGMIEDVLSEYSDRLEFNDWRRMWDAGNINEQIGRAISQSSFGICYLSEPAERDEGPAYQDNVNVVFEAGMLHARTNASSGDSSGEPAGWIPIREADSPAAPFDFASERILTVPRGRKGEVNESAFRDMLRRRLAGLLGAP